MLKDKKARNDSTNIQQPEKDELKAEKAKNKALSDEITKLKELSDEISKLKDKIQTLTLEKACSCESKFLELKELILKK